MLLASAVLFSVTPPPYATDRLAKQVHPHSGADRRDILGSKYGYQLFKRRKYVLAGHKHFRMRTADIIDRRVGVC